MNRAVEKITVGDSEVARFRAGDVVRVVSTGEVLKVTAARGGTPRSWHTVRRPLWVLVWSLIRYRKRLPREYRVVTDWYMPGLIRGYRMRPSPLPRRLP